MGLRKYKRQIAKARLAEMGANHINQIIGSYWRSILSGPLYKRYLKEKRRKERRYSKAN